MTIFYVHEAGVKQKQESISLRNANLSSKDFQMGKFADACVPERLLLGGAICGRMRSRKILLGAGTHAYEKNCFGRGQFCGRMCPRKILKGGNFADACLPEKLLLDVGNFADACIPEKLLLGGGNLRMNESRQTSLESNILQDKSSRSYVKQPPTAGT